MSASQKNSQNNNKQSGNIAGYEQKILYTSSIGVLITQIGDGTILYANKAIANLLGLADITSVIGMPVPNFYWDMEDRKTLLERFNVEGSITNNELRARRIDGSMLWVSISIQPFEFEGKQALLSEIADVSARKKMEEELSTSEERFRSIYDNATIGLYRTTPDGQILMINPTGLRLLGFASFEELSQRNLEKAGFEQEDARKKFQEKLEREGVINNLESEWKKKDGSTIFVLEGAKIFRDENGKTLYYDGSFEDITTRKQAEAEIKYLASFIETANEAIMSATLKGEIVSWNGAAEHMFGYTREEIIGKPAIILSPPELREQAVNFIQRLSQGENILPTETLRLTKDGRQINVLLNASAIKNEAGQVTHFSVIMSDITEDKRAEEALSQTRSLYQSLVEVSPMSICRKDLAGRFTFANQRFLEASQTTLADLVGKTDFDLHPSELAEKYRRDDLAVMESGKTEELIEERAVHEGETTYVETVKTPIYDEDRKVSGIQVSFWDITARKRAEEEMRRLQNAMEQTADGVALADLNGNILYTNPAWAKMHGYTVDEILGKHLSIFHTPEQLEKEVAPFNERAMATGGNTSEIGHARKDGTTFPTLMTVAVQKNDKDQPVGLIGTIRDITENKRVEQELQENQKFLTLVLDTMPGFLFWKDRNSVYLGSNKLFAKGAGLNDPSEIVGKSDHELAWTKEEADAYIKDDNDVMESGIPKYHIIEPQLQASGKQTWVDTTKIPLHDAQGNVIGILGTFEDITERKQAEEERSRLAQLVQSSSEFINMSTLDGKMIFLSDAGCEMVGIDPQKLDQHVIFEVLTEDSLEKVQSQVLPILMEKGVWSGELQYRNLKTGNLVDCYASTFMIYKENGEPLYLANISRDITENKRLENEAQEAFERRGYQVQVSTEISQEVAATTELNDLFKRVVTLTKERLGYYHTQLLRYDAAQDAVILINGYGETGQKMLAGGHKMPMGSGLIGTAAATGETILRPILADDPDWQPNPLLPETKGEIAVPIKWQNTVLGVLDVQSDQAGALGNEDRLLLEGLCGQIAIAMHSAELVESIRQNEAKLSEALLAARLANWEYDVEKDLFTFNDEFYSIFRTTVEKAGGYQISSARYAEVFVHPDDMKLVGSEIEKSLISTERVYNTTLDHRIVYEDGGVGYITVKVTVERDENGKITRYYGANQDITERKLAQEALESERRLLRTLMSTMLDLVYVKDSEHRFLLASDTVVRSLGAKTSDEVVGKTDFDFHPRELAEQYFADEKSLMESGLPLIDHEEASIDHATGAFRWLSSTKIPLRDIQGNIIGLVGLNRDVTERKQAEEVLRVNEARLAEALKIARLANWEYDVEKDIFTFNDQFYSLFHTTAEKVGGYQITSAQYAELFVYPDDAPIVGVEIGKALNSTERVYNTIIDHRILYEGGGLGHIAVSVTVERDENGKITRFFGANQDITERKKAEEEMAERLEEINSLYRAMSHEGWNTYRETADLPTGFIYDQTGTRPIGEEVLADELFANIPMRVLGGEVVGTLTVADDPRNPTSDEERAFLLQVSDQIALALEGARLSAQTQSALAQTEKLSDASLRLTRATDLQELLQVAVETLGIPKINRAIIGTFERNSAGELDSMTTMANWWNGAGHKPTEIGTHYTLQMIHVLSLFLSPVPVFFDDTFNDPRLDPGALEVVTHQNIRAIAVLPLYTGSYQTGVLLLESEEVHNFTQDETRLFSAMGPQIATVLENRRQFARAQQQADRESTLNVISQKIQSATTVEAVLQIAARELGHALGAPMTIAQLSMKDKK